MDWIILAEESNQLQYLVNTEISYGVPKIQGIFPLSEKLQAVHERFISIKLVSYLVSWLVSWSVGLFVCLLVGWLVDWLVG